MDLLPSAHVDTFTRDRLPAAGLWPDLVFELDDVRYPGRLNCARELMRGARDDRAARPCLIGADRTWTYAEVDQRSDEVAHALVDELGVVPGNRVLLCGPNSPWLVACWLGVLKAGAVVVTVVPLLRAEEIQTVAGIAEVSVALCAAESVAETRKAAIAGLRVVVYGGHPDADRHRHPHRRRRPGHRIR